MSFKTVLMIAGAASALTLGACREDDLAAALASLPATTPAPGYTDYGAYTGSGPIPIGYPASRNDAYAWGERAYGLDRVFYDTPPDYGFDYNGVQPWVWQTDDRWQMYADPYQDDYRYYYYAPGQQRPYYIRDDNYGYGYDNDGRLVAIFNLLGQLMPNSFLGQQAPLAANYYNRAYDMRRYGLNAEPVLISQPVWQAREPIFIEDYNPWLQAAQVAPWVAYRQRTDGVIVRAFEDEVKRRKAHPGFPAHAKGWGPPALRDAPRRVVVARAEDPRIEHDFRQPVFEDLRRDDKRAEKDAKRIEKQWRQEAKREDHQDRKEAKHEARRFEQRADIRPIPHPQAERHENRGQGKRFERRAEIGPPAQVRQDDHPGKDKGGKDHGPQAQGHDDHPGKGGDHGNGGGNDKGHGNGKKD